ncbi:MarR family winged helix-turn-helix transcriptional regulator [Companilactobacillus zhongbaensis]|uniref:MarR family winged helix-turn-helix transcriptional regulator n=1 Tax=Companilactobacillus zhongbaensis TaxID=2486009 RepID=UPI000F790941|nr:MarR family transcriptional regulator [Companilactobacillus zhongbaensis]
MEQILRPLGIIARSLDSIANLEFKDIELSRGQYIYLVRICEDPGINLERLTNLLKVDKTTAARSVQKLEKKGLITRQIDAGNRKIKKIYPTEKGKSLYPLLLREEHYSNSVAMKNLTTEQQEELSHLLNLVVENVSDDWDLVKSGKKREY